MKHHRTLAPAMTLPVTLFRGLIMLFSLVLLPAPSHTVQSSGTV